MFKNFKLMILIHKFYNKIMRIKLIKAVMGVFTVLMSYKIIKFIWYFNKAIIYIIGLLFVGVN